MPPFSLTFNDTPREDWAFSAAFSFLSRSSSACSASSAIVVLLSVGSLTCRQWVQDFDRIPHVEALPTPACHGSSRIDDDSVLVTMSSYGGHGITRPERLYLGVMEALAMDGARRTTRNPALSATMCGQVAS